MKEPHKSQQNNIAETRQDPQKMGGFAIVGITTRTNNRDGEATTAINQLWQRFFEEAVGEAIPAKDGEAIYAVYHSYAGNHDDDFSLTIGCRVKTNDFALGAELDSVFVESANYAVFAARGDQPKALLETWQAIWKTDLNRTFKTDLEIYGPRFFEAGLHEVLVCIGVSE